MKTAGVLSGTLISELTWMATNKDDSSFEFLESFVKYALEPICGGWERKNLFISLSLVNGCCMSTDIPLTFQRAPGGCLSETELSESQGEEEHSWGWSSSTVHACEAGPSQVWGVSRCDSQVRDGGAALVISCVVQESAPFPGGPAVITEILKVEPKRNQVFFFYFLWILKLKRKANKQTNCVHLF